MLPLQPCEMQERSLVVTLRGTARPVLIALEAMSTAVVFALVLHTRQVCSRWGSKACGGDKELGGWQVPVKDGARGAKKGW